MPRTQVFPFDLGDKVDLIEIKRPGIIKSINIDSLGTSYSVAYWNDCARRTEWVYEHEIALRTEPTA